MGVELRGVYVWERECGEGREREMGKRGVGLKNFFITDLRDRHRFLKFEKSNGWKLISVIDKRADG